MSRARTQPSRQAAGFTLAEMVVVIVLTAILAAMAAVFIQRPVQGFFDTTRRAALADAADSALRRLTRDLREALPNSVRVAPGNTALEFLHIRSAGRYREQGPGNILDFTANDTSFDVLGPAVNVQNGDSIVVYNLGITGSTAYSGTTESRRLAQAPFGTALASVSVSSSDAFPFASPSRRFQVIDTPVSYICTGTQMRRYWGYGIQAAQPTLPGTGSNALVVDNIAANGCAFSYDVGLSQRDALVTVRLTLTSGGESVSLVHQVHVNNAP